MTKLSFKEALAANKKKAAPVEQKAPEKTMTEQIKEMVEKPKKPRKPAKVPEVALVEALVEVMKDELPKKASVAFTAARMFILDKVNAWVYKNKYNRNSIRCVESDDALTFYAYDDEGEKLDSITVFDVELHEVVRKYL